MSLFSILLKFNFLRYPGVTLQQIFSGAEKARTTQHRAVTAALEINIYNFTLEQKKTRIRVDECRFVQYPQKRNLNTNLAPGLVMQWDADDAAVTQN